MIRYIFLLLIVCFISACSATSEFPNDENGFVLKKMKSSGIDLTKEYLVDFCHLFNDAQSAHNMANEVVAKYLDVEVDIFIDHEPISVCVSRTIVPTHEQITATEFVLGKMAESHGGVSDGWGFMASESKI
jgi:hypothetical protein